MTITEKFSCGAVSYVVKGGCNSWVYGWSFLITKSRLIFCYIWKKELDEQLKKKELVPIFRISTQCTLEAKRNNRKSLLNQKLSFLSVPPSSSFGLLFCRLNCKWYGMTIRKHLSRRAVVKPLGLKKASGFLKQVQDWLIREVCITYFNTYLFCTSSEKIDHCLLFEKKITISLQ